MPIDDSAPISADPGRIKVAIVFSIAGLGGAERSLTRMAMANKEPDVQYLLSTLGGEGDWTAWLRAQQWRGTAFDVGLGRPWRALRLLSWLRAESPDVIYAVGARVYLVLRSIRWFLPRVKVVQALRAMYPAGSATTRRYVFAEKLFSPADAYIANSRAGAETYARATGVAGQRIRVILNGVDVPAQAADAVTRVKGEVLIVANLMPGKGHLDFMDVASRVVQSVPHATFVFLGRDDMNGLVQARARALGLEQKVSFPGYRPDVGRWMDRASLFVLPSRDEGAPTSILEAQAHGLPVVAYPCGGVPEVVRHGEDGLVAEDLRNESLAAAIVELLLNESRGRSLGQAGRDKVLKEFSLAACSRRHGEEWRKLVAR